MRPGAPSRGPHAQRQKNRGLKSGCGRQPMLAHKAVYEGHVAAEVIAGELQGNKELAAPSTPA
jgi:hypothetical protein